MVASFTGFFLLICFPVLLNKVFVETTVGGTFVEATGFGVLSFIPLVAVLAFFAVDNVDGTLSGFFLVTIFWLGLARMLISESSLDT